MRGRRKLSLGLVAAAVLLVVPVAPAPAQAPEPTCWAEPRTPWLDGGTVRFPGRIKCKGSTFGIRVTVEAIKDGRYMGRKQNWCSYAEGYPDECGAVAEWPNRRGNQEWCTIVEGHYSSDFGGSGVVEPAGVCEKEAW